MGLLDPDRIHYTEARIRGSGSTSKCDGSATLGTSLRNFPSVKIECQNPVWLSIPGFQVKYSQPNHRLLGAFFQRNLCPVQLLAHFSSSRDTPLSHTTPWKWVCTVHWCRLTVRAFFDSFLEEQGGGCRNMHACIMQLAMHFYNWIQLEVDELNSSPVVGTFDCPSKRCNSPGFNPSVHKEPYAAPVKCIYIIMQLAECRRGTCRVIMEPAECIHGPESAVMDPAECSNGTCRVHSWNLQSAIRDPAERVHETCSAHSWN